MRPVELKGAHAVVFGVVLELGEAEGFKERREVHAEAPAETFLEAVPAPYGVLWGAAPGFYGAFGGGLLFVGAAEEHPVAVGLEHGVEVFDGSGLVVEDGLADGADEDGRVCGVVAVDFVVGGAGGRFEVPGIFFSADGGHGGPRSVSWFDYSTARLGLCFGGFLKRLVRVFRECGPLLRDAHPNDDETVVRMGHPDW